MNTESIFTGIKWAVRVGFVLAGAFALVAVLAIVTSVFFITLNNSVVGDLFAIVQIWLPFNFITVFVWILTASVAFIGYRLALTAISWLNRLVGTS